MGSVDQFAALEKRAKDGFAHLRMAMEAFRNVERDTHGEDGLSWERLHHTAGAAFELVAEAMHYDFENMHGCVALDENRNLCRCVEFHAP